MSKHQVILLSLALGLIGGTAGVLARVSSWQKLAPPGVVTSPTSNPKRLRIELPETVLNYTSKWVEPDEITLRTLPQDTSFGQRHYEAPDGFSIALNVVLMGTDRTSLHKPQFCLEGQGWHIDSSGTLETHVKVDGPTSYDLPVVRLIANKVATANDAAQGMRAVYTYWFVADDAFNASVRGLDRMVMIASRLLRTGALQRWAYVSCFSSCQPGDEEAVFERTKEFIAAAAPSFVIAPGTARGALAGK